MRKIIVVGSANADLMIAVAALPKPGETVRGRDFMVAPGGKGANQATAAARLGGDVSFVGSVGEDDFGKSLKAALLDSGVDTSYLQVKPGSTGVALVLSEASGENSIAIAAGANDLLLPADIDAAANEIAEASIVVCQFESPLSTIERVIEIAKRCGVPILLNPAPARPVTEAMLKGIRFLVPNRHELADLTGLRTETVAELEAAAKSLLTRGVETVIVTLGREGVLRATAEGARVFPAPMVHAVDTTGAGDTFVGAFAAEWCRTSDVDAAIMFAQRAAAHSVTGRGAQASMPWLSDLVSGSRRLDAKN
ncbi:MAG: ribokinase [Bradyrhizobium sp.]